MPKRRFDIPSKIKVITHSEDYELFDVETGSFFDELEYVLADYGMPEEFVEAVLNNLPALYDTGNTDGISPLAKTLFIKYLDTTLEYIGAKIYSYLEFLDKDDYIIKRIQLGNQDKVFESEAVKTGQSNKELDASMYLYADIS